MEGSYKNKTHFYENNNPKARGVHIPRVHGANFQKLASENKTSGLEHIDLVAQLPPRWDAGSS